MPRIHLHWSLSLACFLVAIPRILSHTLASYFWLIWFGEPLGLHSWVSFGFCIILGSTIFSVFGSVSSFARGQKYLTWASSPGSLWRMTRGRGHIICEKLWQGSHAPHSVCFESMLPIGNRVKKKFNIMMF